MYVIVIDSRLALMKSQKVCRANLEFRKVEKPKKWKSWTIIIFRQVEKSKSEGSFRKVEKSKSLMIMYSISKSRKVKKWGSFSKSRKTEKSRSRKVEREEKLKGRPVKGWDQDRILLLAQHELNICPKWSHMSSILPPCGPKWF